MAEGISYKKQKSHCYLTVLLCVIYLTPILFRFLNSYIQLALFLLWCAYSLYLSKGKISKENARIVFLITLMIGMEFGYFFFGKSSAVIGNYFKAMKFYQTIVIYLFAIKYYSKKFCDVLSKSIILILGGNLIYNVVMYFTTSNYLDYTGRSERITADATNIFNTMYATAIMLFSGVCISILLYRNIKKSIKIFALIFLVLSVFYTIVIAERATNLLLMIAMFGLILSVKFFGVNKAVKFVIFVIVMGFFAVIIYITILPNLLLFFGDIIKSDRLSRRILSIHEVITGGDINNVRGTLDTRYHLMSTSIDTFKASASNFLFGIGNHMYNTVDEAFTLGIGGHSQLIDMFAKYGILGGGLVIGIIGSSFKKIKRMLCQEWFIYFLIIFMIFIVRSVLGNTFEPEIGLVVFVLMPLIQESISKETID